LLDTVVLNLQESRPVPFYLDVFSEDGKKETLKIDSHREKVQLQTKLSLMIRAPLIFYDNDPDWRHIQDGVIALVNNV